MLLYHISKLALRVPLVFTKKHGIYAARLMLRLRLAFTNRTYYTCLLYTSTLHDTTLHDYPSYNGSYAKSNATGRSYLER